MNVGLGVGVSEPCAEEVAPGRSLEIFVALVLHRGRTYGARVAERRGEL